MGKELVIVESPAKARTVGRFLGSKYIAKATMGHVRDLPRGGMGIEINDDGFYPSYSTLPDKRKIVAELAKASKEADTIYLATDPDREGEAISWHLIKAAKIDESKARRVVFHEITRDAVREAFQHSRDVDYDLINAQQTRRILDRLVGYRLSPVLWGKVRRGLSAGRVQSVALKLVVDREREIQAFTPQEHWSIEAKLIKPSREKGQSTPFAARLHSIKGQKGQLHIPNEGKAKEITSSLDNASYHVASVKKKLVHRRPSAPFITSTLQQEAWRKLRFTARRTMQVAQQLYEGLPIGDEGSEGIITYMRTDSTNVASTALKAARQYIKKTFGDEYTPPSPRIYTTKVKGAQEAHEAIRPTSIERTPEVLRKYLTSEQAKVYELIWKRMLASQMADAKFDSTAVDTVVIAKKGVKSQYIFRSTGSVLRFPGFRKLYMEDSDDLNENDTEHTTLPSGLVKDDPLDCLTLNSEQHFTQPPPRYTEATIIRAMEQQGIGRPSTYAPTIATLIDRIYVQKNEGRFVPTKLGTTVTDLLTTHFPDIMDIGFTARVEQNLDDIASGELEWVPVLKEFYTPFDKSVEKAMKEAKRVSRDQIDEQTDEVCEKCERPMVIKTGRFGRFLSCSGFPECRNSRPLLTSVGVNCPECGGNIVERRSKGKGGRPFYGCSNYPNCTFAASRRPLPQPCPQCSKLLVASGRSMAQCTSCEYKGPAPDKETIEVAT